MGYPEFMKRFGLVDKDEGDAGDVPSAALLAADGGENPSTTDDEEDEDANTETSGEDDADEDDAANDADDDESSSDEDDADDGKKPSATTKERKRWKGVLGSSAAKGRESLAVELLGSTNLGAAQIRNALAKANGETTKSTQRKRVSLATKMASESQPKVPASSGGTGSVRTHSAQQSQSQTFADSFLADLPNSGQQPNGE